MVYQTRFHLLANLGYNSWNRFHIEKTVTYLITRLQFRNHIQIMRQLFYIRLCFSYRGEAHLPHSSSILNLYKLFRYTTVQKRNWRKERVEEGVLIWHTVLWEDFLIKFSRQNQPQKESSLKFILKAFVFIFTKV